MKMFEDQRTQAISMIILFIDFFSYFHIIFFHIIFFIFFSCFHIIFVSYFHSVNYIPSCSFKNRTVIR